MEQQATSSKGKEGQNDAERDGLKRDPRRRTTAQGPINDDLSNTQQFVYLSSGGDISGFKMKAIAIKMRHKLQREQSMGSEGGGRSSRTSGRMSPSNQATPQGEEERVSEHLTPTMLKVNALKSILLHPFSVLLLAFPLGIWSAVSDWKSLWTFWLNILAMIPLAKILGDATEELADAIQNDTASGLLNATLGNAVEMILTIQTLRAGLLEVVKATLLGSILSNLLLVLGTSFLLGGLSPSAQQVGQFHVIHAIRTSNRGSPDDDTGKSAPGCITYEKEQLFTVKGALVNMAMHLLSIMTVALPTVMGTYSGKQDDQRELVLSRCGALVIMSSYVAYIFFHLVTHKDMLAKDERCLQDDDDDAKHSSLGALASTSLMLVVTLMIGVSSQFLVDAMEDVVKQAKLPSRFIGVILLPFAGNACEHASAVRFAMIDRPGLTIGIAMGSSTQISLFVVPFAVLTGWYMGKPMNLDFGVQNLTILFLATLVVLALVLDGRSNWLKGFLLCNAYVFISLLYWLSE